MVAVAEKPTAVFADKRADFHRYSKELEDAFHKLRKAPAKTAESKARLRAGLTSLSTGVTNLLFCAGVEGIEPTKLRLSELLSSIQSLQEDVEASLASAVCKQKSFNLGAIATTLLGVSPSHTGLTLAEFGENPLIPIAYAHYIDVLPGVPTYSLWLSTNTRRAATGFVPFPHSLVAWSRRCATQAAAVDVFAAKMAADGVLSAQKTGAHNV